MQQQLMQMQPMMGAAAYHNPNTVTTDIIQQYLDENKSLILQILDNQSAGKLSECAESQARLQKNLMYLAAIADSQPQPTPMHSQFPPNAAMQPGSRYLQHQQAQQMTQQSLMAARSSMLYAQQPLAALQQQQGLHGQLGMSSAGNNGLHMMHGETGIGGNGALVPGGFADFRRNSGEGLQGASSGVTVAGKHDGVNAGSAEGRGGNTGQGGDGTEPLYLKGTEEEGN